MSITRATPLLRFPPPRGQSKGEAREENPGQDRSSLLRSKGQARAAHPSQDWPGRFPPKRSPPLPGNRPTEGASLIQRGSCLARSHGGAGKESCTTALPRRRRRSSPPRNNEHTATLSGRRAGRRCFLRESRPRLPLRASCTKKPTFSGKPRSLGSSAKIETPFCETSCRSSVRVVFLLKLGLSRSV